MDMCEGQARVWGVRFVLMIIAALALVIRVYYVHTAVVLNPIRGDVNQYYSYAWNLIHHHTFSMALPNAETVTPDGFRDPGYPFFLASIGAFTGTDYALYSTTLVIQSAVGAATVWIFGLLAYRWTGVTAGVFTGLLLTFWPHGISLGGTLLSETLFGLMIAVVLLGIDTLARREEIRVALFAGLSAGLASLTSAVVTPFGPLFGLCMAWRHRRQRRLWMVFVACSLIPVLAWGLRSTALPAGRNADQRAAMNFVQGSWPDYHPSYLPYRDHQAWAIKKMEAIDAETAVFRSDPSDGIALVFHRFRSDPWAYIRWYLSKPLELWGWPIGIGQEDIYVFPTSNSPLSHGGLLAITTNLCFFFSPFLMLLAVAGVFLVLRPRSNAPGGLRAATCLALLVTLIYCILQADARYATPFRGIQASLAAFTVSAAAAKLRKIRAK